MSSGFHCIAYVEIENGTIRVDEVWGRNAPSDEASLELTISFTTYGAAHGNIHGEPFTQKTSVFLTSEQLDQFTQDLKDFQESQAAMISAQGNWGVPAGEPA